MPAIFYNQTTSFLNNASGSGSGSLIPDSLPEEEDENKMGVLSYILLTFISLALLILVALALFLIVQCICDNYRWKRIERLIYQNSRHYPRPDFTPLSFEEIYRQKNRDPQEQVRYLLDETQSDNISLHSQTNCAICLDEISLEEDITMLSCGHLYHRECISQWFTDNIQNYQKATCPTCRHSPQDITLQIRSV